VNLEAICKLIREGKYFFYVHALTEAKKDGVEPEDAIAAILSGKIIETYPERKRVLILGQFTEQIPLHVVCDYSNEGIIIIPTDYIPDRRQWIRFQIRKPKRK
jgi:hypothetical protein